MPVSPPRLRCSGVSDPEERKMFNVARVSMRPPQGDRGSLPKALKKKTMLPLKFWRGWGPKRAPHQRPRPKPGPSQGRASGLQSVEGSLLSEPRPAPGSWSDFMVFERCRSVACAKCQPSQRFCICGGEERASLANIRGVLCVSALRFLTQHGGFGCSLTL